MASSTKMPIVGISNIGNTCFMNSIIQLLMSTHELNSIFDTCLPPKENVATLTHAWNALRHQMSTATTPVTPSNLVNAIQSSAKTSSFHTFSTGRRQQHDASELLVFMVDQFHEEMAREMNITVRGTPITDMDKLAVVCYEAIRKHLENSYSEVISLFMGVMVTRISTPTEKNIVPEVFTILSMPLPPTSSSTTLVDCIDRYCTTETFAKDSTAKDSTRRTTFWSLPQILVIQIHRGGDGGNIKHMQQLQYPLTGLDMSSYVEGYDSKDCIYDLYGVCNHFGTHRFGHYTAIVRPSMKCNDWFLTNDASISPIDEAKIAKGDPSVYCLFYRKRLCN
jgi:ubiquitin carboxyl-terminal hydrolase 8